MRIHKIDSNRFSINRVVFEWSTRSHVKQFGFFLRFDNWEIVFSFGLIFGTLWVSIPHRFLFKNFKNVFSGGGFGEYGREVGFMVSKKTFEYSLWWWSNINKPRNTWRCGWYFIGGKK